jgi:thioredoxin 1
MSNLREVSGEPALRSALAGAAGLCVVDFYATWCGPCIQFAPTFAALATQFPSVLFLKVCEMDSTDAMMARDIKAFPTFHLYVKSAKVDETKGASEPALRALILKHVAVAPAASAFGGSGMTLGSRPADMKAEDVLQARLRAMGGGAPKAGGSPLEPLLSPASLASLQEMGFGQVRAARALLAVGGKAVEGAMQWLETHQDDAGLDVADEAVTAAIRDATSFKAGGAGGGAEAGGGGDDMTTMERAQAQEEADAEVAAAIAAAGEGEAPAAPPRKLTAEETLARVKAIRAAKAATAKEEARVKEIARREDGQKAVEAAELNKDRARKAEVDRLRREKEAEAKEKARLQLELLKDRAEREAKQHGKVSDETAAKLKAMVDGKPPPALLTPREAIKKAVNAMTMQKKDSVGRIAAETLVKMLGNVAGNPGEDKFRELRYSMKVMKERLLVAPPAIAVLTCVGFAREEGSDGTQLRMSKETAESAGGQEAMLAAVEELSGALANRAFD